MITNCMDQAKTIANRINKKKLNSLYRKAA